MNDIAAIIGAFSLGVLICLIAGWVVNRIDRQEQEDRAASRFTVIDDDDEPHPGCGEY